MKKILTLFLSLSMIFALTACGSQNGGNDTTNTQPDSESTEVVTETPAEESTEAPAEEPTEAPAEEPTETPTEAPAEASTETDTEAPSEDTEAEEGKTLVVYYSATGNTEEAANYIAAATGADTLELVPAEPYTDEDLNYNDDSSRVVYEHDNPDARAVELVESTVSDWESYDTVFIGYPIWWGIAAWPVDGFIAANDFTGKTIIPFTTHGGSGFSRTIQTISELQPDATVISDGLSISRNNVSGAESDVAAWVHGLDLDAE